MIEFRRIKGRGDGRRKDNYETVFGVFQLFFYSTIKIQTYISGSPLRSDRMDEMGDANRTLFWVTHRTTGRGIQTMIGHSHNKQNSRRAANVERGAGQPSIIYRKRCWGLRTSVHRDSRWDSPRKRALFTSDGPDSTTSGSDIPEGHADRPPEVEYSERLTSAKRQDEGGTERLCSPNMELEMAVIQLQRDVDECRTELELARKQTPAVTLRPQRRSWFTSTPVVCSNGWDDVKVALQLLSHLDGDALNVALLVLESRRVVPGFLIKSLSDHYNAPGRLAEYKRQLQRAFRRPGDDPSIFATETLARRAFMDIDTKIQLQLVRDRFIDGQAECALRRHFDSLGPNTPMTDIVDCCRVWESHRKVEI